MIESIFYSYFALFLQNHFIFIKSRNLYIIDSLTLRILPYLSPWTSWKRTLKMPFLHKDLSVSSFRNHTFLLLLIPSFPASLSALPKISFFSVLPYIISPLLHIFQAVCSILQLCPVSGLHPYQMLLRLFLNFIFIRAIHCIFGS